MRQCLRLYCVGATSHESRWFPLWPCRNRCHRRHRINRCHHFSQPSMFCKLRSSIRALLLSRRPHRRGHRTSHPVSQRQVRLRSQLVHRFYLQHRPPQYRPRHHHYHPSYLCRLRHGVATCRRHQSFHQCRPGRARPEWRCRLDHRRHLLCGFGMRTRTAFGMVTGRTRSTHPEVLRCHEYTPSMRASKHACPCQITFVRVYYTAKTHGSASASATSSRRSAHTTATLTSFYAAITTTDLRCFLRCLR